MEIIERINICDTMGELNFIRLDVVKAMQENNGADFEKIQDLFRKKKNKLIRIPWADRAKDWDSCKEPSE